MFIWFFLVVILTIYGIVKEKKATRFDVTIGLIVSPLFTFIAAFIFVWSLR